jgi:phosphatidylserine/phosphatidylglycerophosphate/cardiolipin synthase-like enzyme
LQKIAIILRKNSTPNIFREIILSSFGAHEFDELLICSGFFQEKKGKKTSFLASQSFATKAPQYPCKKNITTVGIYNNIWKKQYDDFTTALANIKCSCGTSLVVKKRQIKKYHWHAKVFIASSNTKPIIGIIGSSNITSRAFGALASWNYEADVVLWDDSNKVASKIISEAFESNLIEQQQPSNEIIVSNYAIRDLRNRGLTLSQRLATLQQDIENLSSAVE